MSLSLCEVFGTVLVGVAMVECLCSLIWQCLLRCDVVGCEKCSAVLMEIMEMMKVMDDLLFGRWGFAPSLSLCLCGIAVCFCGWLSLFGNGFDFGLTL